MPSNYSIGVDWSNGSWLGVVFGDSKYEDARVMEELGGFFVKYPGTERLLVDIPIGLFQEGDLSGDRKELVRECDAQARRVLGRRHSSVFNPPARDAVEETADDGTYESVKKTNMNVMGKGLQKQAFHISDAIYEVDQLLQENEDFIDESEAPCVLESHPEVCFRALKNDHLSYSKKSAPGLAERLEALEQVVENPGETLYDVCAELHKEGQKSSEMDVDIDDALDALVLAVVASADEGELQRLPHEDPPKDKRGIPMQMVYRAKETLPLNTD